MRCTALTVFLLLAAGCKASDPAAAPTPSDSAAAPSPDPAAIRVVVDGRGFTPSSIKAQRAKPLALEFLRTSDDTCAKEVSFPELALTKPLPLNSPVKITVPADASKTYAFACGMGMFKGQLIVQ